MSDSEFEAYRSLRRNTMARAIFVADGELAGYRDDWNATDGTVSEETRAKYLAIADDVLDKIEWRRFALARVSADGAGAANGDDHDAVRGVGGG